MPVALRGVRATKGFLRAYGAAIAPLQGCIEGAVHDFIRSFRANPTRCLQSYDRVTAGRDDLLEIDVAGGPRLIALLRDSALYLLDVGDHEITKRWSAVRRVPALGDADAAPPQFLPESNQGFFTVRPDKSRSRFANEFDPEWLYFLDGQQTEVVGAIIDRLQHGVLTGGSGVSWIVAGPGTGKTSVLLNLLKWAVDAKLKVALQLSTTVREYIESCLGGKLPGAADSTDLDLLLVDDPATLDVVREVMDRVGKGRPRFAVIGFDPLQLTDSVTDQEFNELAQAYGVAEHHLQVCYRQKANVGQAASKVAGAIAASTPFLAQGKIKEYRAARRKLTSAANRVRFPNPKGYVNLHLDATPKDVVAEVRRVRTGNPLWKHWPPLLVVCEDQLALPDAWKAAWSELECVETTLDALADVKGIECQHCFIVIGRKLYEAIEQGFKGSGQSVYNERRLLRIPFSRAKDSLVTFVVGITP